MLYHYILLYKSYNSFFMAIYILTSSTHSFPNSTNSYVCFSIISLYSSIAQNINICKNLSLHSILYFLSSDHLPEDFP